MAEIQNTFIQSKMNKDLDDRIVPSGEYRDATNISISRSESDSVGALENVLGNELIISNQAYATCIGAFPDKQRDEIYYFVTDYIDSSITGFDNHATIGSYHAIIKYNVNTNIKTVLLQGTFLNFSARSFITGANIIEDLLFWTDNRNQPRKINTVLAESAPYTSGESPIDPYYTNEDQISVAKYYPWKTISLMDIASIPAGTLPTTSTMTNPSQEFIPKDQVTSTETPTFDNPDYEDDFAGDPEYLKDRFIRLSYRFKFDDNEYSLMAPFTQVCFVPKQNGYFLDGDQESTFRSTVMNFFENNITQIIASIEFETATPDVDFKIKELDILYKESDALQVKVIESVPIATVLSKMQSNTNTKVYDFKYISTKPYKGLPENQIVRVYDKVPVRALAQEVAGNRIVYGNFFTTQSPPDFIDYNVRYGEKLSTAFNGTSQVEYPNHTLKQNRNYQVGFILADRFGRQSSVVLSANDTTSEFEAELYVGSTIYVPYKPDAAPTNLNWPGYALRTLINSTIPNSNQSTIPGYPGLYKDGSYSVDLLVLNAGANGTGYVAANNVPTTGGSGTGLTVDILTVFAGKIGDIIIRNAGKDYTDGDQITIAQVGSNLDGEFTANVAAPNPLGWYSYKIVVRQTEQDYYNCFLPSILDGYPINYVDSEGAPNVIFERGETANIVLINDNINKIPRDLNEVGPDQRQYRSSVKLFGRVQPLRYILTPPNTVPDNFDVQYYPTAEGDSVVSISTLSETNYNNTTGGDLSGFDLNYPEFYQSNTDPLIARINTTNPIGETNNSPEGNSKFGRISLAVYETDAFESLLDIYWETSSSGLISELNTAILEGGDESAVDLLAGSFILTESDGVGSDCFELPITAINRFGNVIFDDIVFELSSVLDGAGNDVTTSFSLLTGGGGTAIDPTNFQILSQNNFWYGSNPQPRTFSISVKCTYTNPSSLQESISYLSLLELDLVNRKPTFHASSNPLSPILTPTYPPIDTGLGENPYPNTKILTLYGQNGSIPTAGNSGKQVQFSLTENPEERFYLEQDGNKVELWVYANMPGSVDVINTTIRVEDADSQSGFMSNHIIVPVFIFPPPDPQDSATLELDSSQYCDNYTQPGDPGNAYTSQTGGSLRYELKFSNLEIGAVYDVTVPQPEYTNCEFFFDPPTLPACQVPNTGQDFGVATSFTANSMDMSFYFSIVWGGSEFGQTTIKVICTRDGVNLVNSDEGYVFSYPPVQSVDACGTSCNIP